MTVPVGFTVGELEAVFSTSRTECRMGLVQLRAVSGGYNTTQSGVRKSTLGDAEYRRTPPAPPPPKSSSSGSAKKASALPRPRRGGGGGGGMETTVGDENVKKSTTVSPKSAPTTRHVDVDEDGKVKVKVNDENATDPGGGGGGGGLGRTPPSRSGTPASPYTPLLHQVDPTIVPRLLLLLLLLLPPPVVAARCDRGGGREGGGNWEVGERGAGVWAFERGVNVLAIRASDLAVVYDRTWDISGGRRPAEANAAATSLRDTFDAEANGELRRGGTKRWRWGAHFIVITTSGAWAMAPSTSKDGQMDDTAPLGR